MDTRDDTPEGRVTRRLFVTPDGQPTSLSTDAATTATRDTTAIQAAVSPNTATTTVNVSSTITPPQVTNNPT